MGVDLHIHSTASDGQLTPEEVVRLGLEAYYNGYSRKTIDRLVELANKHGLITSGGSDFHGLGGKETPIGGANLPSDCAERLIPLAEKREKVVTQ